MYYSLTLVCLCLLSSVHTTGATSDTILMSQDDIETALAPMMKFYQKLHNLRKYINYSVSSLRPLDPECSMNATELITSKGYPCEDHTVQTKDGYLLDIQRIPYGIKNKPSTQKKPVVLLQHGLLGASTNFLTNLANESLGYILADAGYDVWLGNSRGNTYARRHITYPIHSNRFWAFSFDQMAKYDLPATINYITKTTGQEKIFYVGHSQGTLIAFLEFSQNKELAQKIKLLLAMGPVFTVANLTSPIGLPALIPDKILFDIFQRRSFLPKNIYIDTFAQTVCRNPDLDFLCEDIINLMANFNDKYLNRTRLPIYLSHTPAGTSTQNMDHFAQLVRTKTCQKYNYDSKADNFRHYGQFTPPKYDASKVDIPVALFSGGQDTLADPTDVHALSKLLQNVVANVVIPEWGHLEFIWAIDAPNVLYKQMIQLMQKY